MNSLSTVQNHASKLVLVQLPTPICWCRFLTTDLTTNTIKNWVSGQSSYLIAENVVSPYLQSTTYRTQYTGDNAATNSKCAFCVYGTAINAITFTPSGGFTIAFWVYPISTGYTSGSGDWMFCFQSNNINTSLNVHHITGSVYTIYDYMSSSTTININCNQWYHICYVFSTSGVLTRYVNNAVWNTTTISIPSTSYTTNRFSFGYGTNSTPGYYQEIYFYNYPLNTTQLSNLYNST